MKSKQEEKKSWARNCASPSPEKSHTGIPRAKKKHKKGRRKGKANTHEHTSGKIPRPAGSAETHF